MEIVKRDSGNLVDDAEDLLEEEEGGLGSLGGGVDEHLHRLLGQADSPLERTTG